MIPITKPYFDEREIEAVGEVIRSGWVTQGPKVVEFERAFAASTEARFACAVSSGTSALHIALLSVGVQPGDVVITVSHSFIATANAVRCCGAEPVFIDIEPIFFNLDPQKLQTFLETRCEKFNGQVYYKDVHSLAVGHSPLKFYSTPNNISNHQPGRVAAILTVHQMGIPCALEKIASVANCYHLPLIEDAACAIGSKWRDITGNWQKIGSPVGQICCFSFHPRKIIVTGDGGMLTTNDPTLDRNFRLLRHHGMSISDYERHLGTEIMVEHYEVSGFNYRMTDIQAALGIEQLKKLDQFIQRRNTLAESYHLAFKSLRWIRCLSPSEDLYLNWQSFPVILGSNSPISRDQLMKHLLTNGVSSRPGIMNAHVEPAYALQGWNLPISEKMRESTILLPLYHDLTEKEINKIAEILCAL